MPHPDEPYYCSEQIAIPPEFPDILKQFTKAAIRTQPSDLLLWSAKYFRCLANGETPPVKDRLEMLPVSTQKTDTGLTIGLIQTLHKQISKDECVKLALVEDKWKALNLPKENYDIVVQLGNFSDEVEWIKFMAIAASTISKNLVETMTKVCEVLTADPPGANARIKFTIFQKIYEFLATQVEKTTPKKHVDEVCNYLTQEWIRDEYIHPKHFTHPECPNLSFLV